MSKHTPGPWRDSFDGGYYVETAHDIPGDCGLVCAVTVFAIPGRDLANARLIAAAPELLEALESVLEDFELLCNQRGIDHTLLASLDKPRAAIAKATGGE